MLEIAIIVLAILYLCNLPVGIPLAITAIALVITRIIAAIYKKLHSED